MQLGQLAVDEIARTQAGYIEACAASAHGKHAAALAVDDYASLPAKHAAEGLSLIHI